LIKYSPFDAVKAAGGAIRTRWPTMELWQAWHLALSVLIHVSICCIDLEVPVFRSVGLHLCGLPWPAHFL
jgi:hypothetical protein